MSTQYVSFSLENLTVTFYQNQIVAADFVRSPVEMVEHSRTALGFIIATGRLSEDFYLFDFSAVVSEDDAILVDAMYWRFHELRRLRQPNSILAIDTLRPFIERSPRTRAVAPEPFNTTQIIQGNYVKYYAQFWTMFNRKPVYDTRQKLLTLSLIETEVKTTP